MNNIRILITTIGGVAFPNTINAFKFLKGSKFQFMELIKMKMLLENFCR